MDDNQLNLSETEKAAKAFALNLLFRGFEPSEVCDVKFTDDMFRLPDFYDDDKFKRGQKYFSDNRFGIMQSNLYGLFALICEPNGAMLLDKTQHSSTPATARKRYADTTLHMLSWCTEELKPGSRSWESLKRVRKMHLAASNASIQRTKRGIPQTFMVFTAFGFMGYALVKPHLLGIKHDCLEDREAFVHMWAVICYMLGIKDEYNLCLQPFDVLETICHIMIRYNFIPFLQVETKSFEKLGRAFIEGMKWYIRLPTYKSQLFLARRLAGIPGYQYDVDLSKEFHVKQIFTKDELTRIRNEFQIVKNFEYRRNLIWDEKIPLINIKKMSNYKDDCNEYSDHNGNLYGTYKKLEVKDQTKKENRENILMELLELKNPSELEIIDVDDGQLKNHLNDRKFYELTKIDQLLVKSLIHQVRWHNNSIIKYLGELGLSIILSIMEWNHPFLSRHDGIAEKVQNS